MSTGPQECDLRYDCSEDLLDYRKNSLKCITPLDVSSEKKGPNTGLLWQVGILASSNLRNRKSISVRNSKFSSVSSKKTLRVLAILKVNDAMWRHTVSRTDSLIPLETPPPLAFFLFFFFFSFVVVVVVFFEVLVKTTIKIYYSDKTTKRLSSYKLASVYSKILEYKKL